MGAYSPAQLINKKLEKKIINRIVRPTLNALKEKKSLYWFFIRWSNDVNNEPYLIEYNIRMGDPECQTILPKLKTDLRNTMSLQNKLNKLKLNGIKINV